MKTALQIHWAAKRGDFAAVRRQLGRAQSVNALDGEGRTPLMYAAESSRAGPEMLELLVRAGADVNAVSTSLGRTPLSLAAHSFSPRKVAYLLSVGANARFVNGSGYTAITGVPWRRCAESLDVLRLLLAAGTDPNQRSTYGECPLRCAVAIGNFAAVRSLLEYGVEREPAGFNDLMWAIAIGTTDEVQGGLRAGVDLAARDTWERTPPLLSVLSGDVAKAELLLAAGAQFDDRGRSGETSLMYAAIGDDATMARWLLNRGADPNAVDKYGQSVMIKAAEYGATNCVKLFLDAGALWDQAGDLEEFAITSAANSDIVAQLVAAGADINRVPGGGYHLLKSATEAGDVEFVRALLKLGAKVDNTSTGDTALHMASSWDHLDIVQLLLQHGADPNAVDVDGWTPLMGAQSLECVELLLAAGASVKIADQCGHTVLHHHADIEILDRLAAAGASLDEACSAYYTPLHQAAQNGELPLAQYFVARGINVNAATSDGVTPLMNAAERGHVEVMQFLLAEGADASRIDDRSRSTLFYAAAPEGFTAFELAQRLSSDIAKSLQEMHDRLGPIGATPHVPDFGYRPSDDVQAIELLVAAGADLEMRDRDGRTPLLFTARCGRPSRVAALLRLGANPAAKDSAGRSARTLVAEHWDPVQREQIVSLLKSGPLP